MNEQEIKAKALELTIQTIALMTDEKRNEQFSQDDPAEAIIGLSRSYLDYLQKKPN